MIARHWGLLPLLLTVYTTVPDSKLERKKRDRETEGKNSESKGEKGRKECEH